MRLVPDFSEAKDFDPIPDGTYTANITDWELKTSQKGAQYVSWTLTTTGAEGDLAQFNGRKVWHNTMLSGPGSGMLKQMYKNITSKDIDADFDTEELMGQQCIIDLATETNQMTGEPRKTPTVKAIRGM